MKTKINKQIIEARQSLRKIYGKYSKELYNITIKVDKYLEGLQEGMKGGKK
jgi:hypothetical protein